MQLCAQQQVILGPPGCGKTTALLTLVEQHIEQGIASERIAYFSFTRKAVDVAKTRARERFSLSDDALPFFRTVHSMVFALNGHTRSDVLGPSQYREIAEALGIAFGSGGIDDSTGLVMGAAEGDRHLFIDGLARARRVSLQQQWEEMPLDLDFRAIERTVAAVTRFKQAHALVDFTDMLETYGRDGFPLDVDAAFIDEAQDLSTLQWDTLRRLLQSCPVLYIAGDDDQAIYRWSGADVRRFLALSGDRHVLAQSWRCPRHVHRVADDISTRINTRINKSWAPRETEGYVEHLQSLDGFDFAALQGTTLLLARNAYLLTLFTEQLRQRGLTYRTQHGAHSVRPAHARAIYAYTHLMKGLPIRGSDAKSIYDQLRSGIGVRRGFKALHGLENDVEIDLSALRATHGLLAEGPWYETLDGIAGRDLMYYRSVLRGGGNLLAEPTIHVNTIHGVKGGEADNVVVCPDMAWQTQQHFERDPDDEHRVAYVAVSRAKSNLFLLAPATKNFYPYF
jgi:superfamily I DNA/RNA helicase